MIINWLKNWAQISPQKKFINDATFFDVDHASSFLAKKWEHPLQNHTRIGLLSENSLAMCVAIFALLKLGKEILFLNTHLSLSELTEQISDAQLSTVVSASQFEHRVTHLPLKIPPLFLSVLTEIPKLHHESFFLPEQPEKIAFIMNTSATTGKFKSVPITEKMVYAQVKASKEILGSFFDDNWLIATPLFHVSGLSILMRSLYNGTAVSILSKFDEDKILKAVETEEINMMSLVPTMLSRLIERLEKHRLRVILLGGAFIPRALIDAALKKELPIYKTYGMTETFSQSATLNLSHHHDKLDAVGRALPTVQITLKNVNKDGIGEIMIDSPMVMRGYLLKPPLSGPFETGDIGFIDADGFLYVLNRRNDIIISGGENIYPKEIENLVYELPEIEECVVIPRADEKWGQVPVLYYSCKDSVITDSTILSYLKGKLAKFKLPRQIIYCQTLPKNASGKIIRKVLK
ncbi:o-succinylbenzoate--CoA ligase [Lactococcus hircilactis]|uniref:o-succinylbenzoate--CoA ligase n=1 Tax=Lactococcus hircilactis TaxID=1494462 RepID=UPI001294EC54|nr:o-succinylbenzoate--CoA ligase [Lactococcus hircilactis]